MKSRRALRRANYRVGRAPEFMVAGTTPTGTHAGHFYNFSKGLSRAVFHPDYPENPRTLGEKIRRARMDRGMEIKDLAAELGVSADTVINWELRGMVPRIDRMGAVIEFLGYDPLPRPLDLIEQMKRFRTLHGWTAARMAEEMGVDSSSISSLERREHKLAKRCAQRIRSILGQDLPCHST